MAALLLALSACGGGGGGGTAASTGGSGSSGTPATTSGNDGAAQAPGSTVAADGGAISGSGDAPVVASGTSGTVADTPTDTGSTVASSGADTSPGTDPVAAATGATDVSASATAVASTSTTRADAWRLATQATFGATDKDITAIATNGAAAWLDDQLLQPASINYQARWDADNAAAKAVSASGSADAGAIISQFYLNALSGKDQLRQRVAFALSEIMVISTQAMNSGMTRSAASYMDMLSRDALGNYRTLLQDVAMHPAMATYLSSIHNVKENTATGQMPDQNFAREVMQLMSIGLVQLNADGTKKLSNGSTIETYTTDDVVGMSKVFTGWSYSGPDASNDRFWGWTADKQAPDRLVTAMQAYPQYHSTSEKRFLGTVVAAQSAAAPAASLATALDTLFKHPNVGPFIGRQLIQRLVTSHPSDAYVGRVAAVFNDNGKGMRGDLKATVRALLLDPEARAASGNAYGKVREPVLRLTAWMRAFNVSSKSGKVLMRTTDDPARQLAQSPLRSPSVFNFFRPGYVANGSETGALGLTMPELQITNESTVAGYINFMATTVSAGTGQSVSTTATVLDMQANYASEAGLAAQSAPLVDDVTGKLLGDGVADAFKAKLRAAVDSIAIPALKADKSNQAQVTAAINNRVYAAVLLAVVSPEFIVQK